MSNTDQLQEQFEVMTASLISGDLDKRVSSAITNIPVRDAFLRFAYDNPELRPTLSTNLEKLISVAVEAEVPVIRTVRAGVLWLDGLFEETMAEVTEALSLDSEYSLARLLNVALTRGIPSRVWADSLKMVSHMDCLTGNVD